MGLKKFFEIKTYFLNNYQTKKTSKVLIKSLLEVYTSKKYEVLNPKAFIFKNIFGSISSFKIFRKS